MGSGYSAATGCINVSMLHADTGLPPQPSSEACHHPVDHSPCLITCTGPDRPYSQHCQEKAHDLEHGSIRPSACYCQGPMSACALAPTEHVSHNGEWLAQKQGHRHSGLSVGGQLLIFGAEEVLRPFQGTVGIRHLIGTASELFSTTHIRHGLLFAQLDLLGGFHPSTLEG